MCILCERKSKTSQSNENKQTKEIKQSKSSILKNNILSISGCDKLEFIPSLPENVEYLFVYNCKSLKAISPQKLKSLDVMDCANLTEIANSEIQELNCYFCPKLRYIEKMSELRVLKLNNCDRILQLPEQNGNVKLYTFYCPVLEIVPACYIRVPSVKFFGKTLEGKVEND